MTNPPAASATPPITSKPIQRPHGVVSESAVADAEAEGEAHDRHGGGQTGEDPQEPLEERTGAYCPWLSSSSQRSAAAFVVHELAAALDDPVERAHEDPHAQELERNGLQRRPGESAEEACRRARVPSPQARKSSEMSETYSTEVPPTCFSPQTCWTYFDGSARSRRRASASISSRSSRRSSPASGTQPCTPACRSCPT